MFDFGAEGVGVGVTGDAGVCGFGEAAFGEDAGDAGADTGHEFDFGLGEGEAGFAGGEAAEFVAGAEAFGEVGGVRGRRRRWGGRPRGFGTGFSFQMKSSCVR